MDLANHGQGEPDTNKAAPPQQAATAPIPGGYVLLARLTTESTLWSCSPDIFRLAMWLLLDARHSHHPKKYDGFHVCRGEVLTSLRDIAEACVWHEKSAVRKWSPQKVSRMIGKLTKLGFLTVLSDTYGTHLRICKYEHYQNPEMYVADRCGTDADRCGTDVELNNKGKNGKNAENGKKEDTPRLPSLATDAEAIYQAYPKKVGKGAAIKAIGKAIKAGTDRAMMLERVQAFAAATNGADQQYLPNPATWFNEMRWEDDPEAWKTMGRDKVQQKLFSNEPQYRRATPEEEAERKRNREERERVIPEEELVDISSLLDEAVARTQQTEIK
jgi:hypothetical protein